MIARVLLLLLITTFCRAQVPGKTLVFKARAPATECSIICKENFFWLETENPVQITVKAARNIKTKVEVTGGKIMSVKDDIYYILFTRPGTAVISVYQTTMYGRELVATKKLPIKNPDIYFLDIKLDSVSKFFRLRGANVYAYSHYYKKRMPDGSRPLDGSLRLVSEALIPFQRFFFFFFFFFFFVSAMRAVVVRHLSRGLRRSLSGCEDLCYKC